MHTPALLAQVARPVWGWSLVDLAITVVVITAVVALVYVALRQFGVTIPDWVRQVFWIVAVAFVVILAIRILAGL